MSVWVWQGCHTLLQIPILLFLKNLFFCSSVFSNNNMFSCLQNNNLFLCSSVFSNNNMFSCSLVFLQQHVLLFFCLFKQQHVLMSSCLQNNNMFFCLSSKRAMFSIQSCLYVAKKNG